MNRRNLLAAGSAAMALAGTGATVATQVAAPSPILDAGRRIADLDRQHDAADVPGGDQVELDRISRLIVGHERFIIAATPATATEALVVLMVAVGHIGSAGESDEGHEEILVGMAAAARAAHCLAGAFGMTMPEFGSNYFLPAVVSTGRAA